MSVAELLVSLAVFAGILVVAGLAVSRAGFILRHTSGRDHALAELYKARRALLRDLELTGPTVFQRTQVPASLAGYDGDAVNFLTPLTPDLTEAAYGQDGTVFWMRNLTYYLVVPAGHTECAGAAVGGYEDACPHKTLVRVETQQEASDPAVPTSIQTLLTSFSSFPRTPTGRTVATGLLTFRCQKMSGGEIEVVLRGTSLEDARREISIGTTPLTSGRFTLEQRLQVFPKN